MVTYRRLIYLLLIWAISPFAHAQNQANVWYFGDDTGLDFNTGQPVVLDGFFNVYMNSASISDSSGHFLFATNGEKLWNRNKQVMLNGDSIKGSISSSQGALIVQKPGSVNLYYVFTAGFAEGPPADYGLYYCVVDMDLDGGLGGVTNEKNILLEDAWDAADKIVAARQQNSENIWIVTRKFTEDGYAAFLLTQDGINTNAVFSPSIDRPYQFPEGNMKISPDKKYLATAYSTQLGGYEKPDVEICKFNANTGVIELLYTIRNYGENGCDNFEPWGVEFSPDSKFLYVVFLDECGVTDREQTNPLPLYQYDMQYIEDSAQFYDTRILIKTGPGIGLQLARDGKIYCSSDSYGTYDYVSVIHKPWVRGTGCDYEADAIDLEQGKVGPFFPNILTDYLFRFEWEGRCSSEPFVFQSNFIPEPSHIRWSFSDPDAGADSISLELNPVHYFSRGGEYEVKVVVQYPGGRVERTSRVVSVTDSPHPGLGPDTLMCKQGDITLNAGDEEGVYLWSDGTFGENINEITVSDTGWYWVQVTNSENCSEVDSIHVGLYPPPDINEDNLQLVPTTCGGSNGKILGLQVTGTDPLSFEWYDADGNLLGDSLDLAGLTVGNYFLHIFDGNGCITISHSYTIEDAGNIEVTAVEKTDSHCGQDNGSITVTAAGAAEDLLYSVDNGATWQDSNIFENLSAGNYFARAKDPSGCEGVYADNPVVIKDITGLQVVSVATVPETDNLANGEIDITATVDTGPVYYSIDNGATFQTDDGKFTNLTAGTYNCVLKDGFGCDTMFTVEVERTISQLIEAIAGDGATCIGNAAVVPLKLVNFKDIYKFHVTLTYDTSILKTNGYMKVNPVLKPNLQVSIIPGTDKVIVTWQGDRPETLDDNATMLELVFGAKKEGLSGIDWAAQGGESAFYNEQLEEVSAEYHVGTLRVFTSPEISMASTKKVCEGGEITTYPFVTGGSGYVKYEWFGPNNYYSTNERITIQNIKTGQAGIYTLIVTDTINCSDSSHVEVIVNQSPQITFAGIDTLFAQPGFVLKAGSGYASYLWNTGDTTDAIQVNTEGLYSVLVTTTESCQAADTVMVLWGGEPFWLPNAFTPNGDGLNDEFKPVQRYDLVKTYRLFIYNRWGQLIFETSDINQGWDGTYKGKPAEQGTYVYKIVYTSTSTGSGPQSVAGNVTLVR